MAFLFRTTKFHRILVANANCHSLTRQKQIRTQSSKSDFNRDSNNKHGSILRFGVLACGVMVTLYYLKKDKDKFTRIEREYLLPSAYCLDAATQANLEPHSHDSVTDRPYRVREKVRLSKELTEALKRTERRLLLFKEKHGIPGLSTSISVNGRPVWSRGYGYSDVENLVPCTPHTVMRIASISKPIAATAVAILWQEGKLDIDLPVQKYVPDFPVKTFEGKEVEITTRHVMSHMSGIRNYTKVERVHKEEVKTQELGDETEWLNKSHFSDMSSSLQLFREDDLFHAPDTHYLYSTLAWTLVSAAVENAGKERFLKFMHNHVFLPYKLASTQGELNSPLLPHRSRFYHRKEGSKLTNTPYVDNSYKWAGGGFVSNVLDVARFGSIMLGFYQGVHPPNPSGTSNRHILSQETVEKMWSCQGPSDPHGKCVGLGWFIKAVSNAIPSTRSEVERIGVYHSGGAVGASSHLLILPRGREGAVVAGERSPSGVVVALVGNLENVSFHQLASDIGNDVYSAVFD